MAATYQVSPPETFTFTTPEEWPKWVRRFERFRHASGLTASEEEAQVNTLIYCMGDQADDILRSFQLAEADAKVYDTVKAKFDAHFVKRRNVIFERAKFNNRRQEQGEPVDAFITALYGLVEHCGYGELHDEMIRDRIVVGLRDPSLSESLQLDPTLTLEKAVTKVRQREAIKKQQPLIRSAGGSRVGNEALVGMVQRKRKWLPRDSKQTQKTAHPQANRKSDACSRCGKSPSHDRQHCPARDAICRKCSKCGHYQSVCRSAGVSGVHLESHEDDTDSAFLGGVGNKGNNPWSISLTLNDVQMEFLIDTGAEVTVISEASHETIGSPSLSLPKKTLKGPDNHTLPVAGYFAGRLHQGTRTVEQEIYVVRNLHKQLLGRPAIEALELAVRVGPIEVGEKSPVEQFPKLFTGLGKLEGDYSIQLREDAKPFALSVPRQVAIPLKDRVKEELERMEQLGVIARVDQPTDWCAGMVVVPKQNGKVRICVDLTKLNESVRRERHPLPAVEQTLAQLAGAQVFSKLDANSGVWQIPLSAESSLLTTFITPFGRYAFNRLPFGITSAPEHFQRRMSEILSRLEGVVCMMDDILVHGKTQLEHDDRLRTVLQRLESAKLTLNKSKCAFSCDRVKFLGQIVDKCGVHPDPDKVKGIQEVSVPQNVSDVRRFLGMVNQMNKFSPHLAEKTRPIRELLGKNSEWVWGEPQRKAFQEIKELLTSAPILALFDPSRETVVSADASSHGLGAVLLQRQPDGDMKPIAYISRSLTPTETRYAQIEKEALAFTWACERLSDYLIGLTFHIQTDHKPLVPLFSTKNLDELPVRVQRFRLRMMRYHFSISHVPGKLLAIADALSRAPTVEPANSAQLPAEEVDAYVRMVVQTLPVTEQKLAEIRSHQEKDSVCQKLAQYCQAGWPEKKELIDGARPFYCVSSELSVQEGVLMRGNRIVIPTSLQNEMLDRIHTGHQGIVKCRERARQSVWWPGFSTQLGELVKNCRECCKVQLQRAEPLRPTALPSLPFQQVGTDLFEWEKKTYLLVVDYYSRFIEIALLNRTSAADVISHTKSIFARHGIPEVVISDNGPQYSSEAYSDFAKEYQFHHVTSSPLYPQGNGEAERAVRTIKNLIKKGGDPYLALLAYRATPLQCGYSPAELLMCRKLRTNVPITRTQLSPSVPDSSVVRKRDQQSKDRQERNFNSHHGVRELPQLFPDETVWVPDRNSEATVVSEPVSRSYQVNTQDGTYRRNRRDLIQMPEHSDDGNTTTDPADPNAASNAAVKSRSSGRETRPPNRLDPSWT